MARATATTDFAHKFDVGKPAIIASRVFCCFEIESKTIRQAVSVSVHANCQWLFCEGAPCENARSGCLDHTYNYLRLDQVCAASISCLA